MKNWPLNFWGPINPKNIRNTEFGYLENRNICKWFWSWIDWDHKISFSFLFDISLFHILRWNFGRVEIIFANTSPQELKLARCSSSLVSKLWIFFERIIWKIRRLNATHLVICYCLSGNCKSSSQIRSHLMNWLNITAIPFELLNNLDIKNDLWTAEE